MTSLTFLTAEGWLIRCFSPVKWFTKLFSCNIHLFVNVQPTFNCISFFFSPICPFNGVLVKVLVCLPPILPAPACLQLCDFIRSSVIKSRREADFQLMECLSHRFSGAQREETFMWKITHCSFFSCQSPLQKKKHNIFGDGVTVFYRLVHPPMQFGVFSPPSIVPPLYLWYLYLFRPHKQMHMQTSMLTPAHTSFQQGYAHL